MKSSYTKKITAVSAALLLAASSAGVNTLANATTLSTSAAVEIAESISISVQTGLDFGEVAPGASTSVVTVETGGSSSISGDAQQLGTPTAGAMDVSGPDGEGVDISTLITDDTCDGATGVTLLTITTDQDSATLSSAPTTVAVGGTLEVASNAVAATGITCSYNFTVVYS